MRKIECIILPFKLAAVKKALRDVGVRGMKVGRSFGYDRGPIGFYRDYLYPIESDPRLKIEMTVKEEDVDKVVEAVKFAAAGNTV